MLCKPLTTEQMWGAPHICEHRNSERRLRDPMNKKCLVKHDCIKSRIRRDAGPDLNDGFLGPDGNPDE
jgi:hypothetical protein